MNSNHRNLIQHNHTFKFIKFIDPTTSIITWTRNYKEALSFIKVRDIISFILANRTYLDLLMTQELLSIVVTNAKDGGLVSIIPI